MRFLRSLGPLFIFLFLLFCLFFEVGYAHRANMSLLFTMTTPEGERVMVTDIYYVLFTTASTEVVAVAGAVCLCSTMKAPFLEFPIDPSSRDPESVKGVDFRWSPW